MLAWVLASDRAASGAGGVMITGGEMVFDPCR